LSSAIEVLAIVIEDVVLLFGLVGKHVLSDRASSVDPLIEHKFKVILLAEIGVIGLVVGLKVEGSCKERVHANSE
jgi:hypothetical protein